MIRVDAYPPLVAEGGEGREALRLYRAHALPGSRELSIGGAQIGTVTDCSLDRFGFARDCVYHWERRERVREAYRTSEREAERAHQREPRTITRVARGDELRVHRRHLRLRAGDVERHSHARRELRFGYRDERVREDGIRSPRRQRPGLQDGWNRKGLIGENGTKKAAFGVLQQFYVEKSK